MSKPLLGLVLATLLALTTSAAAQAPAGPPPAFEGRWRVVAGEVAPWHKGPRPLMSLAKSGVVFRAEMFSGLSPFGCSPPRYSVVAVAPPGLFQGVLPAGRAAALAKQLGLAAGDVQTLRVDCSNATFDFHAAGPATLKMAVDDVVYTLARPPDLDVTDTDFVVPPEAGFACDRARSTVERVTCADEAAMLGDKRLREQYDRLVGELSRAGREALAANHRAYLQRLHKDCKVADAAPRGEALREAARCLADGMLGRARFLTDVGVVGTRNLVTLEPRLAMRVRPVAGTEGREQVEHDAVPLAVAGPAAAREAFNAHVRELLAPGRPFEESPAAVATIERKYVPSLILDGLVSFTVTRSVTSDPSAAPLVRVLNWNDTAGRPLRLDDLFVKGADWRAPFRAAAERIWPDAPSRDRFLAEIDDPTRWIFDSDKVGVWTALERPGKGRPEPAWRGVEVPASALKPFLRPDSPWRP